MEIFSFKILKNYKWGYHKLIEEAIFTTHAEGMQWLKDEFFYNEYYDNEFTAEVDKYCNTEIESKKIMIFRENYTFYGKQLTTGSENFSDKEPDYNPAFIPKFTKGDLVVFKNFEDLTYSMFQDTIAVISGVPLTFSERKSKAMRIERLDFIDQMYMIEYITDCGLLVHDHILEKDLLTYKKPIPEELKALEYLSLHFNGERPLKENTLQAMMNGEIYMLSRKSWHEVILNLLLHSTPDHCRIL